MRLFLPLLIGLLVGALLYFTKGWWGFFIIFPWIGACIALGLFIAAQKPKAKRDQGRRIAILAIAPIFLIFLGIYQRENLQLEQTVFYLAAGAFSRVLIHYTVAKVLGPLIWGRGFCGWACWTAAILEWLPIQENRPIPKSHARFRWLFLLASLLIPLLFIWSGYDYRQAQIYESGGKFHQLVLFAVGNGFYYITAIILAFRFGKKRAFCKIACPVSLIMKIPAQYARIRIRPSGISCIGCGQCSRNCPMDVDVMAAIRSGKPLQSTECILCGACRHICPVGAIQ